MLRLCLLLLATVISIEARDFRIPTYTVDLDSPSPTRWKAVLEDFVDRYGVSAFEETYSMWQKGLGILFPDIFSPELALTSASRLLVAFETGHPDLASELRTLSDVLTRRKASTVFQAPFLAAATASYVISTTAEKNTTDDGPHALSACTSTLVSTRDGHTLHGRSLDYEPRDAMATTASVVNFKHGNSSSAGYKCLHPLVYPTALQWFTCIRPGSFSLSVNARGQGRWNEHNTSFDELLRRLADPTLRLLGEVAQDAMESPTYSDALTALSRNQVVSSNYFILAGAGKEEGAIVTRFGNKSSVSDVWPLGSRLSDGQPSWMRVQTNVDHWTTFESGAYATHRRQHAVDLLDGIGKDRLNEKNLWGVYTTQSALDESSAHRVRPEDTGAILRPTTIATLILSPSKRTFSSCVWSSTPHLAPPAKTNASTPATPTCYGLQSSEFAVVV